MWPKKTPWFRVAFQLKGSILKAVAPRVLLCGGFGVIISIVDAYITSQSVPILSNVIPSIVLSLLLVFRTTTAYERFWEGRKAWGELINVTRNLSRQIWVLVDENNASDRQSKIKTLRLLVAFNHALKLHLRNQALNHEIQELMTIYQFEELKHVSNPPLKIALYIENQLKAYYKKDQITVYKLINLTSLLNRMVEAEGVCERVQRTPMPLAYSIHLKQLVLLYCLLLPYQMVAQLHFWTGPVVAVVAFSLFGIEEIGLEIEDPFGFDLNDIPLDDICKTMRVNMEDLIYVAHSTTGLSFEPSPSEELEAEESHLC